MDLAIPKGLAKKPFEKSGRRETLCLLFSFALLDAFVLDRPRE